MTHAPSTAAPRRRLPILAALPLVAILALGGLFLARLGAGDASRLPSALIGQAAPKLQLPGLDGGVSLTGADVRRGHVTLVNIFASWCQPCHIEHEFLLNLAGDADLKAKGVEILGVAKKDSADNIRRFLGAAGDPYAKVGLDGDGRAGIDWGVYGVPETFIVNGDGIIAYKFVGPMDAESLEKTVKPEILKAMR